MIELYLIILTSVLWTEPKYQLSMSSVTYDMPKCPCDVKVVPIQVKLCDFVGHIWQPVRMFTVVTGRFRDNYHCKFCWKKRKLGHYQSVGNIEEWVWDE